MRKIPALLNMKSLSVPSEYIEGFVRADNTFLYQLVYDPLARQLVPLTPYPPEVEAGNLEYAGPYLLLSVKHHCELIDDNLNYMNVHCTVIT